MVTINRQLNLVIPLLRGDETAMYVHSTPIRREVFETYYLVIAKTWASFMQQGLDPRQAPAVAMLVLKDIARATPRGGGVNWFEGPSGVGGEAGLLAEMVRCSNVILPSSDAKGWGSIPLQSALDNGQIDEEEKSEVLNLLTFFTVSSHMPPREDRPTVIGGMASMYDLRTMSLNATDFALSLKTSTPGVDTGASPA